MQTLQRHLAAIVFSLTAVGSIVGCLAPAGDGEGLESSSDGLTSTGGSTDMVFLGSSAFLRQCAGNQLGCGAMVASISDSTPYFSAPRTWPRSACNQYYTFRVNGRCVEARRLEVSDRNNLIEGNPGLFDGLGLSHSDGTGCAGSGRARNVQVRPGRHCGEAESTGSPSGGAKSGPSDDEPGGKGTASADAGTSSTSSSSSSSGGKGAPPPEEEEEDGSGSSSGGKGGGSK